MLTDMVMPKMSGSELARQFSEVRPDTKVLYMSGYAEYAGAASLGEPRIPIVQKPFSIGSLVGKVREVLAAKTAEQVSEANVRVG